MMELSVRGDPVIGTWSFQSQYQLVTDRRTDRQTDGRKCYMAIHRSSI